MVGLAYPCTAGLRMLTGLVAVSGLTLQLISTLSVPLAILGNTMCWDDGDVALGLYMVSCSSL